jgi:hypothetical protein
MFRKTTAIAAILLLTMPAYAAGRKIDLTFNIPSQSPITKPAPWHPGITVENAMQQAGIKYVTAWFPNLRSNALLIAEGNPVSTTGDLGSPFWFLCINGKNPGKGMTTARIPSARSKVEWFWTTEATCKAQ